MSLKKPSLIDKSTEELLKEINDLTDDSPSEEFLEDNDVYLFLRQHNLKSGKYRISKTLLYTLYKNSSVSYRSSRAFKVEVNNYIDYKNSYYCINKQLNELAKTVQSNIKKTNVQKEVISNGFIKQYEKFLSELKVIPGNDLFIEIKTLYYFYDKWSYSLKKRPLNFNKFSRLTNIFLNDPVYLTTYPHYGVDKKFYEKSSKEDISKAQEWAKKYKPKK